MSRRSEQSRDSWRGQFFPDWTSEDAYAQNDRWVALSSGRVKRPDGSPVGPTIAQDMTIYRFMKLRCGSHGCNVLVGALRGVPAEWERRPFLWTETYEVRDRQARPPTVRVWHMILDSVTADFMARSECSSHGWREIPTRALLALMPKAVDRLRELEKSLDVRMTGAASSVPRDRPDLDSEERPSPASHNGQPAR